MPTTLTELEILAGGKEIPIRRIVAPASSLSSHESLGSLPSLADEHVFIRKIRIRDLGQLAPAIESGELAQVQLYTGKDSAWAETLTDDSFEAVLEEGQRLNFPSFAKWLRRQGAVVEVTTQNKMVHDLVQQAIREITVKTTNQLGPSPKPANS